LEGIIWDAVNPIVSISGHLLFQGEKYRNCEVLDIEADKVTLRIDGKRVEKTLSAAR
jgi:hypothetical protein